MGNKPIVEINQDYLNAFNLTACVWVRLKKANRSIQATEFQEDALNSSNFEQVLGLALKYCDIKFTEESNG